MKTNRPASFSFRCTVTKSNSRFPRALRAVADRPGTPDYQTLLPAEMERKTPATDPIYPNRGSGAFYVNNLEYECLTQANFIVEDSNPDPDIEIPISTLDTLFNVTFSSNDYVPIEPPIETGYPAMTSYRGVNDTKPSVIFTGFDIWHFKRSQCVQLVDFVLQHTWGLQRVAPTGPAAAHRSRE